MLTVAAFSKLRSVTSYRDFAESLRPLKATRLAPVVVGAEVLVVVLLLTEWALLGYLLAAGLLLVFVIEISRSLRHDVPVSCRCFGGRGGQLGRRHVVRNALLALVSLAGALRQWWPWSGLRRGSRPRCRVRAPREPPVHRVG